MPPHYLNKWFGSQNKRAARAVDKKYLKTTSPEPLIQNQNFTECPLVKLHKGSAPLNKNAARAKDKKYLWKASPPEQLVGILNYIT